SFITRRTLVRQKLRGVTLTWGLEGLRALSQTNGISGRNRRALHLSERHERRHQRYLLAARVWRCGPKFVADSHLQSRTKPVHEQPSGHAGPLDGRLVLQHRLGFADLRLSNEFHGYRPGQPSARL